jgi:hypothetical protein
MPQTGLTRRTSQEVRNTMIRLTTHALERAVERIPGIGSIDDAWALLNAEVMSRAATFAGQGICFVRLGTGNRVVIEDGAVVTVLPVDDYKRKVLRYRRPRFA